MSRAARTEIVLREPDTLPSMSVVLSVGLLESKDSAVSVTDLFSVRFSKYVPDEQ